VRSGPGDPLVGVGREEQLQLGGVEHVVVALVEVEQLERDRRGAAAGDGFDAARAMAAVASCWKTRSGSSVESTVTVVPSLIRSVDAAAAVTSDVGEDRGIERVWCSPKPKKSTPTSSASVTASRTLRIACAVGPYPPSEVRGVSPKLYTPSSRFMSQVSLCEVV